MKHLSKHHILKLCMVLPAVISLCSFVLSPHVYDALSDFRTPLFMPDTVLFFCLMVFFHILFGISAYYVIISSSYHKIHLVKFYIASCFFLFFWPILLFEYQILFFALVWSMALILINLYLFLVLLSEQLKPAILMIPYLLWSLFLCCLNLGFLLLN